MPGTNTPTKGLGQQAHVPLRTAFFDGSGDPVLGPQTVAYLGKITRTWAIYLQRIGYAILLRQQLTGGLTTTVSSPTGTVDGQLLTVLLEQDSAGGGAVAWDSGFASDAPTTINTMAGAVTAFLFSWDQANSVWWPLSSTGSGGGGSGVAQILRQTLVHNVVTTIASPVAAGGDGQLLIVLLTQPASAVGKVAWDAGFDTGTPTAINTAVVGSIARVAFMWSAADSLWIYLWMNAGGLI